MKPCENKSHFEGLKIRFLQELSRFLSGFLKSNFVIVKSHFVLGRHAMDAGFSGG